jgi:hypothetical protein
MSGGRPPTHWWYGFRHVGITKVVAVFGLAAAGIVIDRWFGTHP